MTQLQETKLSKETEDSKTEEKSVLISLNDGVKIPVIGLGTSNEPTLWRGLTLCNKDYKISKIEQKQREKEHLEIKQAIITAIKHGYRHIDTANVYDSETPIGDALQELFKNNVIKRSDIFITSKFPPAWHSLDKVEEIVNKSLKQLKLDYIDLYLLHSPHTGLRNVNAGYDTINAYKTLLKLQKEGKIKSVGVSNWNIRHLKVLEYFNLQLPSVNQIEIHPFLYQKDVIEYCKTRNIQLCAFSPLVTAISDIKNNDLLKKLGVKYNKLWSQIVIKWSIQKGFIPLPKSINENRIKSNFNVFDFKISNSDMKLIDELSRKNIRVKWNCMNIGWGDHTKWKV